MTRRGWGWSSLPQNYLKSPYLSNVEVMLISQVPPVNDPTQLHVQPDSSAELSPDEFNDKLPTKVCTKNVYMYVCRSSCMQIHEYKHLY